jgi:hypothetical protein
MFIFICFTGLPPVFFFFNKLGLLLFVLQQTTLFKGILVLFFLVFGWYAYFTFIRWFSLMQTNVGFSKQLLFGLYSINSVFLWVFFFFFLSSLVFFMDDFFVIVSWFFF